MLKKELKGEMKG